MTTPNKSAYPPDSIWISDCPPVHQWCFSEKAIQVLARFNNLSAEFIDFSDFNRKNYIRLFGEYFWHGTTVARLGEDVPGFYAGASLAISPSRYEGFGYPPAEAMAVGTPVLCADATALREVVPDRDCRFSIREPQELREKLAAAASSASIFRRPLPAMFHESAGIEAYARILRHSFDPAAIFEPGRTVSDHSLAAIAPRWKKAYQEALQAPGRLRSRIFPPLLTQLGSLHRWRKNKVYQNRNKH